MRLMAQWVVTVAMALGSVASAAGQPIVPTADQAAGRWETKAPAPTKRTEVAASAIGMKIYLVGGFGRLGATGRLEVYDTIADRWETKSSMPASLHHVGIGVSGGKLYVLGGFSGTFSWTPVNTVYEYDPATDRWRSRAPMPTARGGLAVGVRDGLLYAVGGLGEGKGEGDRKENSGALEVYDPAADHWNVLGRALPPLPTPRDHLGAAILDDLLVTTGGRLHSSYADNLAVTEVFDLGTKRWRTGTPLPTPRSGVASAVLHGHMLIFGGEAPSGTFHENEAYEPVTDQWTTLAPMPTARHGLGAAVVGERVYVIAGGPRPGGSFSDANERFVWQP
jgi:N-acetylneuraminic acid mutarotase